MNKYLKRQLRLIVFGTMIWFGSLCLLLDEYQYYIEGRVSCFEAAMIPVVMSGVVLVVFWIVWIKEYKKYNKTKIR